MRAGSTRFKGIIAPSSCSGRGRADDGSHGQADPPASADRLQGDRQPRSSGTADDATSSPRTAETAPRAACSYVLAWRSEEHTSELQSLMRISYAVFCLKKKTKKRLQRTQRNTEHDIAHQLRTPDTKDN